MEYFTLAIFILFAQTFVLSNSIDAKGSNIDQNFHSTSFENDDGEEGNDAAPLSFNDNAIKTLTSTFVEFETRKYVAVGAQKVPWNMEKYDGRREEDHFEEQNKDGLKLPRYQGKDADDVDIRIIAQISFHKDEDEIYRLFPNTSCFRLAVEDSSRLDAPAIIHHERYIDLSNKQINKTYVIQVRRPKVIDESFHIVGVLNVGWCAKGELIDWIRDGDYLEEQRCTLEVRNEKMGEYMGRIQLKKYQVDDSIQSEA